jgi:putative phosphoesterase
MTGVQRVLVIGDSHIPERAEHLADPIGESLRYLAPFDQVWFTGDLVTSDETLSFLAALTRGAFVRVAGNTDVVYRAHQGLPELARITLEFSPQVTCVVVHGHQADRRGDPRSLADLADYYKAQVLVQGHTHADHVFAKEGKLFLNPGSCTGAWSFQSTGLPSFMMLYIDEQEGSIEAVRHRLCGDEWEILRDFFDWYEGLFRLRPTK